MKRHLSLILSCLAFTACGQKPTSELKITNGIQKQPDRLSAVIYQDGCTGTFVSPTTILTAAHCADHGFTYKGVKTSSWESMPEAFQKKWGFDIDVRLLVFPKAVAPAWIPVSTKSMLGNEDVLIAGFGIYDMIGKKSDGKFRYGTVTLSGFEANGQLMHSEGLSQETVAGKIGDQSGIGPGDSGGPMFYDGLLVGIASGVSGSGKEGEHKSIHVNLTHPKIKAFLDYAVAKGVDIRFDGKGTVDYEECFDVEASKETTKLNFEVPHQTISSITGEWSVCDTCGKTNAEGYLVSPLKDFEPKFPQFKLGSFVYLPQHQFDGEDKNGQEKVWNGKELDLDGLSFAVELGINDAQNFKDNKGSLKVCFR